MKKYSFLLLLLISSSLYSSPSTEQDLHSAFEYKLKEALQAPLYAALPEQTIRQRITSHSFWSGDYLNKEEAENVIYDTEFDALVMIAKINHLRALAYKLGYEARYLKSLINLIHDHFPYLLKVNEDFPAKDPVNGCLDKDELNQCVKDIIKQETHMFELSRIMKGYLQDELKSFRLFSANRLKVS